MFKLTAKGLWAHRRRLVGMVAAIVLGVGFLAGALALGDTLSANFNNLFTAANGGTDVVVRATSVLDTAGGNTRPLIPATLVDSIRHVPGVASAQPSITGFAELIGSNGTAVGGNGPPRLGANWIADPILNPYHLAEGRVPTGDDEVVINKGAAIAGGVHLGDVVTIQTPAAVRVRIVGVATFAGTIGLGTATFTAFSLHGAERYLAGGNTGLTSIVVRAQPGISQPELASRIGRVLPSGIEAQTGAAATQQAVTGISGTFLTALRTILVVFAGIALLVATFSIANTFSILVAQRNRESALLRALGGTRRQVLGSVVLEALCLGTISSGLGLLAGLGIAGLLKGLFDSFGFALPAGGLVVTATSAVVSIAAGLTVTLAAGLLPAIRASRVAPIAAFAGAAAEPPGSSPVRAIAGGCVLAAGAGLVVAGTQAPSSQVLTIVGLGALLSTVGIVVLGPVVARMLTGVIGRPLAQLRGTSGLLARGNAMRNPRRSAAAATALMVGVAIVSLFTVFAASLRKSVDVGIRGSFVGDVAVSAPSFGNGGLPPQLAAGIESLPGVKTATGLTSGQARIAGNAQTVTGVDPPRIADVLDLHVAGGSLTTLGTGQVAVSQHEVDAHGWRLGTTLPAMFADGTSANLSIGAIYGSRSLAGDYLLPVGVLSSHSRQPVDWAIFVKAAPGASVASLKASIANLSQGYGRPTVADRAGFIASASQSVSFILNIVYVLLALAIVIAVLGIANTLSLAIYERTREIGLLRAVGQTRRQLRSMIRLESVIVSVFGVAGGIGLGTFLGWGLAEAAAKAQGLASFTAPVIQMAVILALGALAGILAAVRPARRAARLPVLGAIATE